MNVAVLSLFIAHLVSFTAFVFHVTLICSLCVLLHRSLFCLDVLLSHLNEDYLLTYLHNKHYKKAKKQYPRLNTE